MNLSSIISTIAKKLGFHNCRAETFRDMCLSVIDQHNVQQHALTKMMAGSTPIKAKLERVRRFFKRTGN